tara:strand:- start:565 stop:1248 length:684 start_codon:yes stop_codon:yes gene_type:complete
MADPKTQNIIERNGLPDVSSGRYTPTEQQQMFSRDMAVLSDLQSRGGLTKAEGYLYKHDLPDEDIARYLDWDKPLSQQPESVRASMRDMLYNTDNPNYIPTPIPDATPGYNVYRELVDQTGSKQAASEALRKAGIPGLKYYDGMSRVDGKAQQLIDGQGSREAALALAQKRLDGVSFGDVQGRQHWTDMVSRLDKDQTRNYVTWDQGVLDRMKLLERNGESMIDALR